MFLMCRIKEGAAVISNADLQNLVTSVILRQTFTFFAQDICTKAQGKLIGSKFEQSVEVNKRCEETISTLYSIDCLRITNGTL